MHIIQYSIYTLAVADYFKSSCCPTTILKWITSLNTLSARRLVAFQVPAQLNLHPYMGSILNLKGAWTD